jgi:hypothetical protein
VTTHMAATKSQKATLASTISDLRKAAVDIMKTNHVTHDEQNERLVICDTCEHKSGTRCNLCRCFLSYKTKLANSECPIGKWSASVGESAIDGSSH